jgi:hypothetical protein
MMLRPHAAGQAGLRIDGTLRALRWAERRSTIETSGAAPAESSTEPPSKRMSGRRTVILPWLISVPNPCQISQSSPGYAIMRTDRG